MSIQVMERACHEHLDHRKSTLWAFRSQEVHAVSICIMGRAWYQHSDHRKNILWALKEWDGYAMNIQIMGRACAMNFQIMGRAHHEHQDHGKGRPWASGSWEGHAMSAEIIARACWLKRGAQWIPLSPLCCLHQLLTILVSFIMPPFPYTHFKYQHLGVKWLVWGQGHEWRTWEWAGGESSKWGRERKSHISGESGTV